MKPVPTASAACLLLLSAAWPATGTAHTPHAILVHSKFGGQIFGFDIDQNGTEGVLSEAKFISGNKVIAAIETFDQATGKILTVVSKTMNKDNFLTLGIASGGTGVVEQEVEHGLYVSKRIYDVLQPVEGNAVSGTWTPPLKTIDTVIGFSRDQQSPTTAILVAHNKGPGSTFVFGSNVAANTFGPIIHLKNPVFTDAGTQMAYDSTTNAAVLAASQGARGGPPPVIAMVDLTTKHISEFTGLPGAPPDREGSINGLAVDAADGIACTTTEIDANVEFYNLKKKTGFSQPLAGATNQIQSGSDVEYDPVNHLFLIAQSTSSTASGGSSIQVYDTKGNLVESLNGFNFSNASNVVFTHIALHPSNRTGYVDGPSSGVTDLQFFTY